MGEAHMTQTEVVTIVEHHMVQRSLERQMEHHARGGVRVTNEYYKRRCYTLPIDRVNCVWRAVYSAARRGARRRVASCCALAPWRTRSLFRCWRAAALRGGC